MKSKRFLVTGILVFLLSLCLAATAFAAPEIPQVSQDTALQPGAEAGYTAEKVADAVTLTPGGDGAAAESLKENGQPASADIKDAADGQSVPAEGPEPTIGQAVTAEGQEQADLLPAGLPVLGVESVTLSAEEQQMQGLVNQERAAGGAGQLSGDASLVKLARLKAQDMIDNRYFDHNSPTYGSPFDMMKRFGISYSFAGENLAMAPSAASAHRALMESPGHRANILNRNFDRVGIGIVVSGSYRYCVQMFTGGQRETSTGTIPGGSGTGQQPQSPPQNNQSSGGTTSASTDEALMVQLVNQERTRYGLPQLASDSLLSKIARLKAQDFIDNNYFAHTSPTYGTFREMLTRFGAGYTNAGENLALSYTVARAHTALMNSAGNKANILNSGYKRVGIGIAVKDSKKYIVQIFTDGGQPSSGGTTQPPGTNPPQPPSTGTNPPGTTDPGTSGLTANEQRMLSLVNSERAKYGLSPLVANLKLTQVARLKAKDMIEKGYFSHTSPTYGSPFDMMRQFGITYRTAGENLAGAPGVDTAHTNLMNSPGHRANILNGSFKEVGIGILSGSQYGMIFVQMFKG